MIHTVPPQSPGGVHNDLQGLCTANEPRTIAIIYGRMLTRATHRYALAIGMNEDTSPAHELELGGKYFYVDIMTA